VLDLVSKLIGKFFNTICKIRIKTYRKRNTPIILQNTKNPNSKKVQFYSIMYNYTYPHKIINVIFENRKYLNFKP
jgi:hypothetical protein